MSLGAVGPVEVVEIVHTSSEGVSIALTGGIAAGIIAIQRVAEIVRKVIPNSAKGWLGRVRDIAGVLAMYRENNTS